MKTVGTKALLRKFERLRLGLSPSLGLELLEIAKGGLHMPRENEISAFIKFCQRMALDPHFMGSLQRPDYNKSAWLRQPLCLVFRMNCCELLLDTSQR